MAFHQAKVASTTDFQEGEMRQVKVGDHDVLLVRVDGQIYAYHAFCSHYGAPLAKGVLSGNRLICPWHNACFEATTGRHLEAPGLDSLARYEVIVQGEDVIVIVPGDPDVYYPNPMADRDEDDERHFAVIGGGAAGAYAVEGMRQQGFTGRITMITADEDIPYDRPSCSKSYLAGKTDDKDAVCLRSDDFYRDRGIEVLKGHRVTAVETGQKRIEFADREPMDYDKLLICSGSTPNQLPLPGMEFDRVFTLRTFQDSRDIRAQAEKSDRAVIVGASFIGLECAFSLRQHGCKVTVVAPESAPLSGVFGEEIGRMVQRMHEEKGVSFHLGREVDRFEGDGRVRAVVLDNGVSLEADFVVVGIGVRPNTGFIQGLPHEEDGGLRTDEYLHAGRDVYAAGDIAHFPYNGRFPRIEHWQVACQQGRTAGMNMAGAQAPYRSVPFFWTHQYGASITYIGHADGYDRIVYQGKPEEKDFLAFYLKDNRIRAVAGMGRSREFAAVHELMREDRLPAVAEIEAGEVDWLARL